MCVVSNIGDFWGKTAPERYPSIPWTDPTPTVTVTSGVSQYEFDKLKKEVEELRKLLLAAKEYDEATGQPDCEVDEKVALIRRIAEFVGVDMSDVFPDD